MIRSRIIVFYLTASLFVGKNALGQDSSVQVPIKHSFIGIVVKLSKNYRTIKNDAVKFKELLQDSTQISRFGLNIGLVFKRELNRSFQIETGVALNNKGYKSREYIMSDLCGSPLVGYQTCYYLVKDVFDFWYADVPLKLFYRLGIEKVSLSFGVGLVFNFLLSSKKTTSSTLISGVGSDYYPPDLYSVAKSHGLSGTTEIVLTYKAKTSLLYVFPYFERTLSSVGGANTGEPGSLNLHSYGVGIGYNYILK